jgi:exodeoxyribonuclease (lambda-induced)
VSVQYFNHIEQRSIQWAKLHLGIPTASGFDKIMTPLLKPRTGEQPRTYMLEKVAERLTGMPAQIFSSFSTEQGIALEQEGQVAWQIAHDQQIGYTGFILAEDGRCGCSPDGLIGDDAGFELKCPGTANHMKYLEDGILPKDYAAQVHGSLYVSGRARWHFCSYHRGLPFFEIVIERDEEKMESIHESLEAFYKDFDATLAKYQS